jgi:phosphopantothenoylcysteine decarboxylase/phosphopantothenate--cysteine ligase
MIEPWSAQRVRATLVRSMSTRFYVRNPEMAAVSRGSGYLFIRPGHATVVMSPVDVEALSQLLDDLSYPRAEATLEEHADRELLDFLVEKRILLAGTEEEMMAHVPRAASPVDARPFRRLVVGLTGAIASAQMVSNLFQMARHHCERIDVILTESAQKIVRPELLEYLGLHVWSDAFEARGQVNVPHIHLAQAADMVVVMPASAHTLYKLAHGACSDLLSLTIAATSAPVVLVPAMNSAMWTSPAVARNVAQLREDGMYVVSPRAGTEVSNPGGDPLLDDVVGGAGIASAYLPLVLASILAVHRNAAMD